jgi:uncharacterized protein YndB with AHSA1/START domain
MPVTSVTSDPETLTMTLIGDYPVPVERLWEAFADPRQIERFWGPPGWPATFTRHDMVEGGRSAYTMTGPDGETAGGYWIFTSIDPGRGFEVIDGFVGDDGQPNEEMPSMNMRMEFTATPDGSRYTTVTTFPDLASMEQLAEMGMIEGATMAMAQMDDVLADLASFAAGRAAASQLLDDTRVRISRIVRGSVEQVWRAHHDADLMRRWMLGPDGWTMPVCEVGVEPGDSYRFEWEAEDGTGRFGFEGEVVESTPPRRAVTTERMIGMDGPGVRNELTLTPVGESTLVTVVVTYPNREMRDEVLATGMVDGMETSYARLESLVGV